MTLYEQAIAVSKMYLGPATESFIDRQCKTRLKIEPSALSLSQLAELSRYVELYGATIMDPAKAGLLAAKIAALR